MCRGWGGLSGATHGAGQTLQPHTHAKSLLGSLRALVSALSHTSTIALAPPSHHPTTPPTTTTPPSAPEVMVSAPQVNVCTGSARSWSHTSTAAPAVANCCRCQWWSIPRKAWRPLNSSTGCWSSWIGPPSKGANGTCLCTPGQGGIACVWWGMCGIACVLGRVGGKADLCAPLV